jgi:hypothetical protein
MIRRFVTILLSLAIALQSVMSLADVDQQHYSEAQHHEYPHDVAELEKPDPGDTPSPKNPVHSEHCHHGHSCFHVVLMANLTNIPGLAIEMLLADFQANFTTGVRASLYRPPIS